MSYIDIFFVIWALVSGDTRYEILLVKIGSWVCSAGLLKSITLKRPKLFGERRKAIFHRYGEKSAVIRSLRNVGCGFPSPA